MKRFLSKKGSSTGGADLGGFDGARKRASLEIQWHPADIRKQVRYIFLSRRDLTLMVLGALAVISFLVLGAVLLPQVLQGHLLNREFEELNGERASWGRRIQAQVESLEKIYPRSKDLRLEAQKIFLAYGLPDDESSGQGGFPPEVPEVPESEYRESLERGYELIVDMEQELRVMEVFAREIEDFQTDYAEQVRTTPSIMPLPPDRFVLTSPFGERTNPFTDAREHHAGLDLAAHQGVPVYATADGVVVFAGRYPRRQSVAWWRYGNLVVIRHNESFLTLYGHCHEVKVRQGQKVARGDLLATVGSTGWSSNPHLHYEVRRRAEGEDFVPVDPRIYILDYHWDDQERLLVRARRSPMPEGYEPLPRLFAR